MGVIRDVGDFPWLASWVPNCQHCIFLWKMYLREPGRNTLHINKGVKRRVIKACHSGVNLKAVWIVHLKKKVQTKEDKKKKDKTYHLYKKR